MLKVKSAGAILCLLSVCLLFAGGAWAQGIDWQNGFIEAEGIGLPPPSAVTPAQGRLMALSAAKAFAYRNLLLIARNLKISPSTNAGLIIDENPRVRERITGVVKGSEVFKTEYLYDGSVRVILRMPLYAEKGMEWALERRIADAEALNADSSRIVLDNAGAWAEWRCNDPEIILNWHRAQGAPPALGLGCFYETKDGKEGAIDSSIDSGASPLSYMRLNNIEQLKRVLFYAYKNSSAPWPALGGEATLRQMGRPDIVLRLDAPGKSEICVVAVMEQERGGVWRVTKQNAYFDNRMSVRFAYNWGFARREGDKQ
ncbi:MAG: hypothetical protein LBO03_10090 [Acidaminococcales bacterium]|nr:hypothetical protein [Acidaminococcales bacterium]